MARMNQAMHDLLRYNASMIPKKRSTFDRSKSHATTFDSGYLIPILVEDVLPGDEVDLSVDALVRMTTPYHPVMDTAYLDIMAFFCPDRIVWDNAKAFYGENLDAEYNALGEYKRPTFIYGDTSFGADAKWSSQSLLDYLGLPFIPSNQNLLSRPLSLLDFRMYQKIWNDFYRASEIQPSVHINYGDTITLDERDSVFELRKVNKMHDYFTSLLPKPQGGDAVRLPIGDSAPVVVAPDPLNPTSKNPYVKWAVKDSDGDVVSDDIALFPGLDYINYIGTPTEQGFMYPKNLITDLTSATASTINNLRTAITVQQALEIDAAGGTRYNSLIASHWGVYAPDDVLQRPQLLGTHREVIGMRQVAQTSATTGSQELGQLGAFSATRVGGKKLFSKSFVEYGKLIIVCCVRPLHTYSQGYPDRFKKLSRFDIYLPVFDNIGNQPVYRDELVAYDSDDIGIVPEDSVLGYKEAWSEYRMSNNCVSGLMRPDVDGSLGFIWTYADDYTSSPILNSDFITEDSDLIGRTLAVQNEPQFLGDFYFNMIWTRTMGVHSNPGLTRF